MRPQLVVGAVLLLAACTSGASAPSTCPITPAEILPTAPYLATEVQRSGSRLYVTLAHGPLRTPTAFAVRAYDLGPPASFLGDTPLRGPRFAISGTIAVALDAGGLGVFALDGAGAPQRIGALTTPPMIGGPQGPHPGGGYVDVAVDGRYAYVAVGDSGMDQGALRVVDLRDPRAPVIAADGAFGVGTPRLIRAGGGQVWWSARGTEAEEFVRVIDVRDPRAPVPVALLATRGFQVQDIALVSPTRALIATDAGVVYEVERGPTPRIVAEHPVGDGTRRILGLDGDHITRLTARVRRADGRPAVPAAIYGLELTPTGSSTTPASPLRLEPLPGGGSALRDGDRVFVAAGVRGVVTYALAPRPLIPGEANVCATCTAGADFCPCLLDAECAAGRTCAADVCAPPLCGDGVAQAGEACDDGNTTPADRCAPDCARVDSVCGDGVMQAGEACDDGNTDPCTGACSADCTRATTGCGDGVVCGGEQCDDGARSAGDGCSALCTAEAGWLCTAGRCGVLDCAGQLDGTFCTRVDAPDRKHDVCQDGACISPGCGDGACNERAVAWAIPPDDGDRLVRQTISGEPVNHDPVTGLTWHPHFAFERTWAEAFVECASRRWAGFEDWRPPTPIELMSVVDYARGALDSSLFPDFDFNRAYLWTSAAYTRTQELDGAWTMRATDMSPVEKTDRAGVICVRSDPRPPSALATPRFVRQSDVVLDARAHLVWTATSTPVRVVPDGAAYCDALALAGHTDWRVPSIKALRSLVDDARYGPAVPPPFDLGDGRALLSSTPTHGPERPMVLLPGMGAVEELGGGTLAVLCVRDAP